MDITIIGAGHVGLVTGACLAELGNGVTCVDNDLQKIESLKKGVVPFYEPSLEELVQRNMRMGRICFTPIIAEGVHNSQIIFIAVGTPSKPDGSADLVYVDAVSKEIARTMTDYKVVVEKSTVPANTGEWIKRNFRLYNSNGLEFDIASVPEFLREGSAVQDFMKPDRIVIGVESQRAEKLLRELFEPLGARIVVTDIKSAELIKHASNCFLATKISYINALADICERIGADVIKVADAMGLDTRIGRAFLDAGVGYGGSCFPKDVAAFIHLASEVGYDFGLLKEVSKINLDQRTNLVKKLKGALWTLRGKSIGILGLSFKPGTDDMREAPSVDIITSLLQEGARVKAYDPQAMENARKLLDEQVEYCQDPYQTAEGCDALVLLTEWHEFKEMDLRRIKGLLALPVFIDGRNLFDPETMRSLGFDYHSIGR